jgi:hypothetical protein
MRLSNVEFSITRRSVIRRIIENFQAHLRMDMVESHDCAHDHIVVKESHKRLVAAYTWVATLA